jgi:hypothetical protein
LSNNFRKDFFSVATTATATDAAATGGGFTGKPDVLGHHAVEWFGICIHDWIRQRAAIPRTDVLAAGRKREQRDAEKNE